MNDDDRLAGLEPVRPRPGLRDDVLARVGAELAAKPRRRRLFWAAAAALLVLIQVALALVSSRHEEAMRDLVGEEVRGPDRGVEKAVNALAHEPEARRLVRMRLARRSAARGLTTMAGFGNLVRTVAEGGSRDG